MVQVKLLEASQGEEVAGLRAELGQVASSMAAHSQAVAKMEGQIKDRDARIQALETGQSAASHAGRQAGLIQEACANRRRGGVWWWW